jgi:hypothetical protein
MCRREIARQGQGEQLTACPFRKLYPDIMLVQPEQDWDSDNGAGPAADGRRENGKYLN